MKKRMNFLIDEVKAESLRQIAEEDSTTMSAVIVALITRECRKRCRDKYNQITQPTNAKTIDLTPEIVADLIVHKLVEKKNGGTNPQDFRIISIEKGEKESPWNNRPPLENYKICIDSKYKGVQSFVYYNPKRPFVCRITKSNQRRIFITNLR